MLQLDKRVDILFIDEETNTEKQFNPLDADEFVESLFAADSETAESLFSDNPDSNDSCSSCQHTDLTQFLVNYTLLYIKKNLTEPELNSDIGSKYLVLKDFLTTAKITGFELSVSMSDSSFDAASTIGSED